VVAVSNGAGGTEGTVRYDAWGVRLSGTGVIPQYGYTGREPDGTGLIYYRGRYYDPALGRFTQRDPIGLQGGLNQYAYVNSNPVNFTDPMGTLASLTTATPSYHQTLDLGPGLNAGLRGLSADWQSLGSVRGSVTDVGGPGIKALNILQTGLDIAGLVPGIGEIADAANAAIYTLRGDYANAALSGLAAIPFVGMAGTVGKLGQAVLGKFPDYLKLADELGAKRFNIPSDVWSKMNKAEQWEANQKFLDRMIARGDEIILSNPVKNINDVSGAFRNELDYLTGKGFRLSEDGTRMIK